MGASMEKLPSNKVKLSFHIDPEQFEAAIVTAYRKTCSRFNIPGFRRGKAPRRVIENHYGGSVFYEEAIDALLPTLYDAAIDENDLHPVSQPEVDVTSVDKSAGIDLTAEVYVFPEVTLGQYKDLEVAKTIHAVTDEDVQREVENALNRASRFVDVTDRPVAEDDQVTMDYLGTVDGAPFDGGTAEDQTLVIGSGRFIPGFEEQLIGMNIGDEKDVNVIFPAEYHAEELAGKPAVFHVELKGIQEKDVPDLDDEFARDVSEFDTLSEYRDNIRKNLTEAGETQANNEFEDGLVTAAAANATLEIPPPMIERRIDMLINDMRMRMSYQGLRLEDFLKYTGQTIAQVREQYKDDAERGVKNEVVLGAIKEAEGIEADAESFAEECKKYAERSGKNVEEFISSLTDNQRENINDTVAFQKVVNLLKEHAKAE